MKKIILIVISILSLVVIVLVYNNDRTFVKKNLENYTGIEKYIVKCSYYDEEQSYIEIIITKTDKEKLLKKLKFDSTFDLLKGKVECQFITPSSDFIYHIQLNNSDPYGYQILGLEKNGNTFILFDAYGN